MNRLRNLFQDNLMKKLLKNASILLSGNVIVQIFGLLSLVLTTRLLGAELFGVLVVIQTYVQIFDRLFNFQSWQALIKYGVEALEENDTEEFKGYIKFGTILDLSTAFVATILALISVHFFGPLLGLNPEQVFIAALYSGTIFFQLKGTPTAILRIFDKFKMFAYQEVISSIIKLLGIIVATLLHADILIVALVWMITDVVGYLLLLFLGHYVLYCQNIGKWWKSKIKNGKDIFRFTWWTNLTSALDLPVKQFDMIIVSSVISFEAVSIYKVFKQVSNIIGKFADPIYQAIYPQLVELIANNKLKKAYNFALKSGLLISGILSPIILIVVVLSPYWLDVIFGEIYATAWWILGIYLVLRLISVTFICIHPLFVAMGYVKKNITILFFTNLLYVVSSIVLGYSIGLLGIVLAYGVQFLSVVLWKIYHIRSNTLKRV